MMSLLAYAIALLSCIAGLLYFWVNAWRHATRPRPWQRAIVLYASIQLAIPVIYFTMT